MYGSSLVGLLHVLVRVSLCDIYINTCDCRREWGSGVLRYYGKFAKTIKSTYLAAINMEEGVEKYVVTDNEVVRCCVLAEPVTPCCPYSLICWHC